MIGMNRALVGLLAVPAFALAGCGGGSSPTATAPATKVQTAATLDPSQYQQAHDLAAKLGCQKVVATPADGVSNGAVETECVVASKPTDPEHDLFVSYKRSVLVFGDPAALANYLQIHRGWLNPHGSQGDRWVVLTDAGDDDAARVQQAVGGTLL